MKILNFVRYTDFREDPILNPLGTPSGKIEIYSKTIEKMNYKDCKTHPSWLEPAEWVGMKAKPAEFALISPHPTHRLHTQLNNTSLRKEYAVADREPIWINTQDAKTKGIKSGDVVRVFNDRGEEGTLCKNGCANLLTKDISTSELANGNSSNTALVNIEKYTKKAPSLTIFKQPS